MILRFPIGFDKHDDGEEYECFVAANRELSRVRLSVFHGVGLGRRRFSAAIEMPYPVFEGLGQAGRMHAFVDLALSGPGDLVSVLGQAYAVQVSG